MANELVKLKTGTIAKLEHVTNGAPDVKLDAGTVYFAVDTSDPNHGIGKIVYDVSDGSGGISRIVMSTQAEYAQDADTAVNVSGVVGINHGGTGAINAAAARENLELGNAKMFFGTCSTAAGTVAKEVTCTAFKSTDLIEGTVIFVDFSNTNSGAVANLTLNVAGTGAKAIKKIYNGGINNLTAKAELYQNAIIPFVYNGTYWIALGLDYNNSYSNMSQAEADAGTATNARSISAKVLNDTILNRIADSISSYQAMIFKGNIATSADVPDIHEVGWTYKVAAAGSYVGQNCEVGDLVICTVAGTEANNDDWMVIQKNIDNALYKSSNTFTSGHMLLADGADGKVKSTAINTTLTFTSGTASVGPKLKATVGGVSSSEITINTATTGVYGATKLSSTASATEESLAATPKGVNTAITNAINNLDVSDTADTEKYVSSVSETNGKISVSRADFSPSITITSGTAEAGPKVNVTVASNSGTAQEINTATTALYGVTKLTSTASSTEESLAATPKLVASSVSNAVNGLDVSDSAVTKQYVSAVSETNGKIAVTRADFGTTVAINSGTASTGPTVKVTVGGADGTSGAINTATTGLYGVTKLSNTSSSSEESLAATPKGVWAAINTLDGAITGTPSAAKTLTAFSQTNGKVSATFADIALAASQITSGTLPVARGGTGQTSVANIQAGKDGSGNTITTTYATKAELNDLIAANDAMVFKGTIATAEDVPNVPYEAGWTYKVTAFGTYAGKICEVGDLLICTKDRFSGDTANDDDWMVVQTNLDNGLFKGTNTFTNNHMLLADGTVGKVKSVAVNPTINLTAGSSTNAPSFTISVGGSTSSSASIGTATTGVYGATKLTNAASSTEESLAATPKLVSSSISTAINNLDVSDTADSTKYVSAVSEANGKISVSRAEFDPSITVNSGTSSAGPTVTISVAGNSATSGSIGTATTGVYGVTKLSNATNSNSEALAATPKAVKAAYDLAASKTSNTGTVTSVAVSAGSGLSVSGSPITTSGTITIGHSNSITAVTTEGLYKIKYDAQGHITGALLQNVTDNSSNADVSNTDTNLITARTLYYQLAKKGYTTNTGTVTKVSTSDGITGGDITTTGTIKHAVPEGATAGTIGASGGRQYIQTITTDKFGHITGYTAKTETVTDTHYTAKNVTTNSATGTSQSSTALTNGNVYLNLIENSTVRSSHKISGFNLINITTDTSGNISVGHTAPTGASATTLNSGGGTREYIKTLTTDAYGHVTGFTTGTESVTDTHYTAKGIVTNSTTGKTQTTAALTNGNVYYNIIENNTVRSTHKISGSDLISVASDASGNIGITHTAPTGAASGAKGSSGRTYLQTITTDAYGHVTGYTTASETVTDTHYTTHLYAGASNGSANAATTNGNTYLMVLDNSTVRDRRLIKGTGATTVTSDASGNITINSTDNDTKNTAGSTDTSSKIFLVGATSQAANPQTYSDNQVYATNGQLDMNKARIAEAVILEYNSTTKSLDFIFA